jgi:molecular chaperone IbpA
MTLIPTVFKDFDKLFVGFDDQWNRMAKLHDEITKNIPNYPPYNIYKSDENKYVIELAVAGFGKQDVEITLDGDKLIVKGETKDDTQAFLYKGIATRAFTRSFVVDDQVVVNGAQMINGMLKIFLERLVPTHKQPKKIDISDEGISVSEFAANNLTPVEPELLLEKKAAKKKSS